MRDCNAILGTLSDTGFKAQAVGSIAQQCHLLGQLVLIITPTGALIVSDWSTKGAERRRKLKSSRETFSTFPTRAWVVAITL
jgi:hypothetical protein